MKNLFTKSNYVFKSFISILFCSYSLERQSNQNCSLYLRNKSRALVVAGAGLGRGGGGLVTSGLMYPCWSWWCLLSSVGALPHTHHCTAISSAMLSTSYKNYQ